MAKKRGKQGVSARPRGEPLEWVTAREVATTLYRKLCIQSESRKRRKRKYNTTRMRMDIGDFKADFLDMGRRNRISDYLRDEIIEAGRDEGIVIGIGDNVVIVTHDK